MQKLAQLLLVLGTLFGCQSTPQHFPDALIIENVTTVDPTEGAKTGQTIVIEGDKIIRLSPTAELPLGPDNEVIDGTGKYLIPGLWDAHVHFAYREQLAPRMFDLFLRYGITSVRDTGGKPLFVKGWQRRSHTMPFTAPRVMIAGPLLDGEPNVYDGSPGRPPLSVGLENVAAAERMVDYLDSLGVDLLKAYEMLTPEQFAAIAKKGREKDLLVTGHVPLSMDVVAAAEAGLNSLEHLRNLELACAANWEELLEERRMLLAAGTNDAGGILRSRIHDAQRREAVENFDAERANVVLEALLANEVWQIPTLTLSTGSSEKHYLEPYLTESFRMLPDSLRGVWESNVAAFREVEVPPFRRVYSDWLFSIVGSIHEKGIPILAGTDCPIFFLTPGPSLHQELATLVRAGLTPLEALRTATVNPARYFELEGKLGSLREGMLADIVLLDADPLADIENTRAINTVIRNGKIYAPQEY